MKLKVEKEVKAHFLVRPSPICNGLKFGPCSRFMGVHKQNFQDSLLNGLALGLYMLKHPSPSDIFSTVICELTNWLEP